MYLRILLNVTKHKVLNILLIFLFIIAFVGVTFSSVFVYKTSRYLNEIYDSKSFTIISSQAYDSNEVSFEEIDVEKYKEMYDVAKDDKKLEANITVTPLNIQTKDYTSNFDQSTDEYIELIFDKRLAKNSLFDEEVEFENDKAYLPTAFAEKKGLNVGDEIVLTTYDTEKSFSENEAVDVQDLATIEIGGIYEEKVETTSNLGVEEYSFIYVPSEFIINVENQNAISYFDASVIVTGEQDDIDKYSDSIKDNSNDANIYDSTTYREKDLDFFKKTRNFFVAVLLTTIVVFAVAFMSLNSNVMDRRNDEFRLYNVFGLSSKKILTQIILEKIVLLLLSLIIGIPLFLKVLVVGNNVVDNLVKYSIQNDTMLFGLIEQTGQDSLTDFLYKGISVIEVNRFIIVLLGIALLIAIICIIVTLQFMFDRDRIVNQRRGE